MQYSIEVKTKSFLVNCNITLLYDRSLRFTPPKEGSSKSVVTGTAFLARFSILGGGVTADSRGAVAYVAMNIHTNTVLHVCTTMIPIRQNIYCGQLRVEDCIHVLMPLEGVMDRTCCLHILNLTNKLIASELPFQNMFGTIFHLNRHDTHAM